MTDEEFLEQLETAIITILTTGQSYSIRDRKYTRADLAELRALYNERKAAYQSENNTSGGTNYGSFR